jgi:hypothetical protein
MIDQTVFPFKLEVTRRLGTGIERFTGNPQGIGR